MAQLALTTVTASNASPHEIPTQSELLALFKEKRRIDKDYTPSIVHLVQLLGGIDGVMDTVLTSPNHIVPSNECMELKQYLQQPLHTPNSGKLKWTLDPNYNMLYQISPFIHDHVFSKQVIVSLMILGLLLVALDPTFVSFVTPRLGDSSSFALISYCVQIMYFWFLAIPLTVAALLRVNKSMIQRIVESVDSWIMIGSTFTLMVYIGIIIFHDISESNSPTLDVLWFCSTLIILVLFVALICCVDGIHGFSPKLKIIGITLMAFVCGILSFLYGFVHEEITIHIDGLGQYGRVPVTANTANSQWVLCLFLSKIAVKTWKKGANRCILVKHYPFIEWKHPSKDMEDKLADIVSDGDAQRVEEIQMEDVDAKSCGKTSESPLKRHPNMIQLQSNESAI